MEITFPLKQGPPQRVICPKNGLVHRMNGQAKGDNELSKDGDQQCEIFEEDSDPARMFPFHFCIVSLLNEPDIRSRQDHLSSVSYHFRCMPC